MNLRSFACGLGVGYVPAINQLAARLPGPGLVTHPTERIAGASGAPVRPCARAPGALPASDHTHPSPSGIVGPGLGDMGPQAPWAQVSLKRIRLQHNTPRATQLGLCLFAAASATASCWVRVFTFAIAAAISSCVGTSCDAGCCGCARLRFFCRCLRDFLGGSVLL